MTILLALLAALIVWRLLAPRRNAARAVAWDSLPSLTLQVQQAALMREDACSGAETARREGDYAEAHRLLTLAYVHIVDWTPGRIARLKAIASWSRFAAAILPPVSPRDFQLGRIAVLSSAGVMLDSVLIGPERIWLRCAVLIYGFRLAVRVMTKNLPTAAERDDALRRFCYAAGDWGRLDLAHLETARMVGRMK